MIIAFGHRRRMGKDTCANLMLTHLRCHHAHIRAERRSFASRLKQLSYDLYGWAGLKSEIFYENHPDRKHDIIPIIGKSARDIWIEFGMACRGIWPDTWAKLGVESINSDTQVAIFSDLRFENEAVAITSAGGKCYRIINPREPKHDDPADSALDSWTGWTDTIYNDGTIKELGKTVAVLCDSLILGYSNV